MADTDRAAQKQYDYIFSHGWLPDDVNDGDGCFRETEIVVVCRAEICSAPRTFIYVIVGTYISGSGAQFEVPAFPENPLVAVAYSSTVVPAFVPGVAAVPEKVERCADVACVEFASVHVETEEVPVEFLAEPVSGFRLYEEMLPFPVVLEVPCVIVS